jgi:hypothetical protein
VIYTPHCALVQSLRCVVSMEKNLLYNPVLAPGLAIFSGVWLSPVLGLNWQVALILATSLFLLTIALVWSPVAWCGVITGAFLLGVAVTGPLSDGPELRGKHSGVGVVMSRSGRMATIILSSVDGDPAQGRVRTIFEDRAPDTGSNVAFFGDWRRPWRSVLPGGWDSAMEMRGAKINTLVRVDSFVADSPERWIT